MTSLRAALCLSSDWRLPWPPKVTRTVRRNPDGILMESLVAESIESAQVAFDQAPLHRQTTPSHCPSHCTWRTHETPSTRRALLPWGYQLVPLFPYLHPRRARGPSARHIGPLRNNPPARLPLTQDSLGTGAVLVGNQGCLLQPDPRLLDQLVVRPSVVRKALLFPGLVEDELLHFMPLDLELRVAWDDVYPPEFRNNA